MSHLGFAVAHCVSQHSPSPLSSPSPPSSGSGSTGRCDSVTASTISAQSPAGSCHSACLDPHRHLLNADVTVLSAAFWVGVYLCTTHTYLACSHDTEHTYNTKSRLSCNDHMSCQTTEAIGTTPPQERTDRQAFPSQKLSNLLQTSSPHFQFCLNILL